MTTIDLAREVGLTPKSVRLAIRRGDLTATRVSKGLGRTASATEFVISREAADDWKARRATRNGGALADVKRAQRVTRTTGAYFTSHDNNLHDRRALEVLAARALAGDEQARQQLHQPWERGGAALLRWWRQGIGEVV